MVKIVNCYVYLQFFPTIATVIYTIIFPNIKVTVKWIGSHIDGGYS